MSDLARLCLLLVGLYLIDMIWWLPPPRLVLVRGIGWRFRLVRRTIVLRPLFPFSESYALEGFHPILDRDGVILYQSHRWGVDKPMGWGWRVASYEQLRKEAYLEGGAIWLAGRLWWKPLSPASARKSLTEWRALAELAEKKREKEIDKRSKASLDQAALDRRLQEVRRLTRPCRILGTSLFCYLFALVAMLTFAPDLFLHWLPMVFGLVGLVLANLVAFVFAHRALFPAEASDRWATAAMLLLNLPYSMRAGDFLTRDALAGFHWLAVVLRLCSRGVIEREAQTELLSWTHFSAEALHVHDDSLRNRLASLASRQAEALEHMLHRAGLEVATLHQPPPREGPQSAAFCPRCRAQFCSGSQSCQSCQVMLSPY